MTQEETPNRNHDHREELFPAYLSKKWNNLKCEICGSEQWALARSKEFPLCALGVVNPSLSLTDRYWPIIPVVCQICANTKLLWAKSVYDWAATPEGIAAMGDAMKGGQS